MAMTAYTLIKPGLYFGVGKMVKTICFFLEYSTSKEENVVKIRSS